MPILVAIVVTGFGPSSFTDTTIVSKVGEFRADKHPSEKLILTQIYKLRYAAVRSNVIVLSLQYKHSVSSNVVPEYTSLTKLSDLLREPIFKKLVAKLDANGVCTVTEYMEQKISPNPQDPVELWADSRIRHTDARRSTPVVSVCVLPDTLRLFRIQPQHGVSWIQKRDLRLYGGYGFEKSGHGCGAQQSGGTLSILFCESSEERVDCITARKDESCSVRVIPIYRETNHESRVHDAM